MDQHGVSLFEDRSGLSRHYLDIIINSFSYLTFICYRLSGFPVA